MSGYWQDTVVCLSVWEELCIVAKRYIPQQVSEQVNRKCASRNTILQLSTPISNISFQTPRLLNHRRWCHLSHRLGHTVGKRTAKNFHDWNSHRQHAAWLFQTRRTIGSSSATAGLLVKYGYNPKIWHA